MIPSENTPDRAAREVQEAVRGAERLVRRGKHREAESAFRGLLADLRLRPRMPMHAYSRARNGLGRLCAAERRDAEAAEVFRKTISTLEQHLEGATADDTERARCYIELTRAMVSLSNLHARAGEAEAAEELLNRAVRDALRRAASLWERRPARSESLANALGDMAAELRAARRAEGAERLMRLELAERERLEQDVRTLSRARIQLAQCLMERGNLVEAERMFRSALEQRIAAGLPVDAITKARCWLANCLLTRDRPEEAEQLLLEGLAELRDLDGHPRSRAAMRYTLARVNLQQGRDAAAKDMLRKGLEDLEGSDADPDAAALHRVGLAKILQTEGQIEAAEATLLRAMDRHATAPLHPVTLELVRSQLRSLRSRPDESGGSLSSGPGRTTLHGLELG